MIIIRYKKIKKEKRKMGGYSQKTAGFFASATWGRV
jgi:hypothetical protein